MLYLTRTIDEKDHISRTGIEPTSSDNRLDVLPLNYPTISSAIKYISWGCGRRRLFIPVWIHPHPHPKKILWLEKFCPNFSLIKQSIPSMCTKEQMRPRSRMYLLVVVNLSIPLKINFTDLQTIFYWTFRFHRSKLKVHNNGSSIHSSNGILAEKNISEYTNRGQIREIE
jgi:hypothetical protein